MSVSTELLNSDGTGISSESDELGSIGLWKRLGGGTTTEDRVVDGMDGALDSELSREFFFLERGFSPAKSTSWPGMTGAVGCARGTGIVGNATGTCGVPQLFSLGAG